jgi:hypothetical protein
MHVELPKGPLIGLREFGLHYLMIVLSILTAIGLEEILRFHHDAEAAREAEESIEHEIFANLDGLRESIKDNQQRLDVTRKLGDAMAEDIRTIKDSAALQKKIGEELDSHFHVGVMSPIPTHEAWDVAVASQAAAHIPRQKLEAYSAAYAYEHDALQAVSTPGLMDAPRFIDMKSDLEIGIVDPKKSFETVREAQAVSASALGNLNFAEHDISKALDKAGIHKS